MSGEAKNAPGVDALAVFMAAQMAANSARYRAGAITLDQWQAQQMADIKALHIASALAAYGGRDQMNQLKWGVVGQIIRQQYGYQRQFLADVLEGRQRQNGRMDNRARMYAAAARTTFAAILRRQAYDDGDHWERNELGDTDRSCAECLAATDMGWVPIGTLSQPGTRTCLGNCRCTLETSALNPNYAHVGAA